KFAAVAHDGQRRKWGGEPYIMHPMRVAGRVTLLEGASEEMVAAAWLHDVVEDCGVSIESLREQFGSIVARYVAELTSASKAAPYVDLSREDRKEVDRAALAKACDESKRIKLCDRLDNVSGLPGCTDKKWASLYLDESSLLLEAIGGCDAALAAELKKVIAALRSQIQI